MKYTIKDFKTEFPTDNACLEYVFDRKYGKDFICPKCSKTGFYRVKNRKCYACAWCAYQIHPLANSIFHKSSTKLTDWFFALYKFSNSKNGVSAKELERDLGCTYKTAWRIAKHIRLLMNDDEKLKGTIEADETYMGGVQKGGRGRSVSGNKIPVVGMVQRKGGVRTRVVPDVLKIRLTSAIRANVETGSSLMTDEFKSYKGIKDWGYKHHVINHSKTYVRGKRGNIHTNSVEGFWSQLKRSINGTYHSVSPRYLQNYCDEFSYRYSRRASETPLFHHLLGEIYG